MARMKDVAKLSGVAESTVSHVINNTRFVSEEVREKVIRAMRELNYHGNAHARRLARGHSDFLGLIISDIENPFFAGLIKAFESEAIKNGFDVLLATTNYDQERTEKAFRKMVQNKVQGVAVMTSRVGASAAQMLEDNEIASVFLDFGSTSPARSEIRLNYAQGTQEAVTYLHNLGHREFAFVAGPQARPSHAAYRAAVAAAVGDLGLRPRIIQGNNDVESGERAVGELLTQRPCPTAILCSNDLTAIGVLRALFQAGLSVPRDVSVVGADDIPYAALTHPALTTVRIPRLKLGALACDLLNRMLKEKTLGELFTLDASLVIRESTSMAKSATLSAPHGTSVRP